jgi:hypothetical protein
MASAGTCAGTLLRPGSVADRISRILAHLKNEKNISWAAVEREIEKAARGVTIDRRRLTRMATGESVDDVSIKFEELEALSDYFRENGFTLLDRPRLLEALVARGSVSFLLGSYARTHRQRTDISRWDVKAMTAILGGIDRLRSGTNFEIRDVVKSDKVEKIVKDMHAGGDVPEGPSLCCLGSPRANIAAEIMLCEMFSVPVGDAGRGGRGDLPFAFVWPRNEPMTSSFSMSTNDVDCGRWRCLHGGPRDDGWAMRIGDDIYPTTPSEEVPWNTYGVAVAQRRPSGQVWLVVAGLTGPATCAVAEVVASDLIMASLDRDNQRDNPEDQGSSVVWVAIEAVAAVDRELHGDQRVIKSWRILGKSQKWRPG